MTQPAPPEPNPPPGAPRRGFLFSGVGLVGAAVGAGAARAAGWGKPEPPPTPDPVIIEKQLPDGTKLSYAQFGEDLLAASLFDNLLDLPKPTYLDIGAFEPVSSNNTYLFYERGARGVLVEPNPTYTDKLKSVRPRDATLAIGIGITDDTAADYYVMAQPQQNTFDKEQAERLDRDNVCKIVRVVKMPLVNVNKVIADHFGGVAPDFLSIDVEGLESAILESLDLTRYRPKMICVDTLVTGTTRPNPSSTNYIVQRGYEVRGMSFANTLYVDKALIKPKK